VRSRREVFKARYGSQRVAAKRTRWRVADEGLAEMMRSLANEAQALAALRHPHVVQYYGLCVCRDHIYIVTEVVVLERQASARSRRRGARGVCSPSHLLSGTF
jgi:serine/threonine protein kinase